MKTRIYRIASIVLLLFNSIGALAGGGSLVTDPSGKGLQLPLEYLQHTAFSNYFIPGLILFIVNGLFGLLVAGAVLFRYKRYPLFMIAQGILLGGWILVQMLLLQVVHLLHISFLFIAVTLMILGFLQIKSFKK